MASGTNRTADKDCLSFWGVEQPLYGRLAKSHLFAFLAALAPASAKWPDTEDIIVPVETCPGLFGGAWHLVCCDRGRYPLCGFRLGRDAMHVAIPIECTGAGLSQHGVAIASVSCSMGQRWPGDDVVCFYSLTRMRTWARCEPDRWSPWRPRRSRWTRIGSRSSCCCRSTSRIRRIGRRGPIGRLGRVKSARLCGHA